MTPSGSVRIPSMIDTYEKGSSTHQNLPRSMAIAYPDISINHIAIHMLETLTISGGTTTYVLNGWSTDVSIKIYRFCKVDPSGNPFDNEAVNTIDISGSKKVTDISGGYCDCSNITPFNVGCNISKNRHEFLAVSIKATSKNHTISNVVTAIKSRSISVTLHGYSDVSANMSFIT